MKIANLAHVITVHRRSPTVQVDAYGAIRDRNLIDLDEDGAPEEVRTWRQHKQLRAAIVKNLKQETQQAHGTQTEHEITFRIRWADVQLADRVNFEGRAFDVVEVVEIGRRKGLELKCIARGPK